MKKEKKRTLDLNLGKSHPHKVRLPGFISDKEVGLGDVLKRATYAIGIKPCRGCEGRAEVLNRWMIFSGKR